MYHVELYTRMLKGSHSWQCIIANDLYYRRKNKSSIMETILAWSYNKTIDMSINLSDIKSRISNFKTKKREY